MRKFDLGGTADSSESGGANIGGTLGSSIMKNGGGVGKMKMSYKLNSNDKHNIDAIYFSNKDKMTIGELKQYISDKLKINYFEVSSYINRNKMMKNGGSLKGKQKNLDLNKNGKLDSEDFKMIRGKMKTGGSVDSHYEKMVKDNWENISYTWETGGKKVPNSISNTDAEDFLNDLDDDFADMNEKEQANAITKFKNAFKSVKVTKMANGGGLADVPESFPETDAISYKNGGEVGQVKAKAWIITEEGGLPKIKAYKTIMEAHDNVYKQGGHKITSLSRLKDVLSAEYNINNVEPYMYVKQMAQGGLTKGFEYSIGGL